MAPGSQRSPLAPAAFPRLPEIAGVRLGVAESGARYRGRPDVLVAVLDPGTAIAGCFTISKTRSAPVDWDKANLARGRARAMLVNAGNANAFTGARGVQTVASTVEALSRLLGCPKEEIFVASTGVIGEPLDEALINAVLAPTVEKASSEGWSAAAAAIMTTDTFPKAATASAEIDGHQVSINGIAKGSGMIAPDMATMLAFLFTDASLPAPVLQNLLTRSVDRSFNAITVDGDTSTSDTILLAATQKAGVPLPGLNDAADPRLRSFIRALDQVTLDLALQVVRDGEGAEKLIAITVTGAEDDRAARKIALAIGNSPLVKTAVAGSDANWGRIVMAVGKSGEAADRDKLQIAIGGLSVAKNGMRDPGYDEAALTPHMQGREIDIAVDVGMGRGRATVWTCDLTHRYIDINGSYRS
ncbi:MAG TPA: bifunctional glutamate N-acetyltransferase/amino-acid acetyltransferase ArgJ [Aestuariivirgaceae bacterium]|nr:bifunctional glutamate N-acetyltransferase/amino-acid acetyltransferase ArgJ [Aestuariivirgaceae bacterium]